MYELSIVGHISSAHFLRGYAGQCRNLHGHNWKIQIFVRGTVLNEIGMVADFGELKEKLHGLLARLDHVCLNDLPFFQANNPTTENIARYIFQEYGGVITPLEVARVQVWESEQCSVIYSQEDLK